MKKTAKPTATSSAKDKTAIRRTIELYAEGMRDGDVKKLQRAFLPHLRGDRESPGWNQDGAIVSGYLDKKCYIKRAQFLFDVVGAHWHPTAAQKKAFRCSIRSLAVSGDMAAALITEKQCMGEDYLTSLQLIRYRGGWRIVSKLFAVT